MKNSFLRIRYENSFKKDYKKVTKQGKDLSKLLLVINHLSKGIKLDRKHCDHALKGEYKGFNECHIAPDWLLIYTGSHSELFYEAACNGVIGARLRNVSFVSWDTDEGFGR